MIFIILVCIVAILDIGVSNGVEACAPPLLPSPKRKKEKE